MSSRKVSMTDRQASQNIESGFVFTALQQECSDSRKGIAEVMQPRAGKPPPATGPRLSRTSGMPRRCHTWPPRFKARSHSGRLGW